MSQITVLATAAHHSIDARTDADVSNKKFAFFLCILGCIRPSYFWILPCVELERIKEGQHFQIGIMPKLEPIFSPASLFRGGLQALALSYIAITTDAAACRFYSSQRVQ